MEIKIVCCDLDGTLLDRSAKVSRENVKGIHALAEKGVYFVPSTGRSFSELPEETVVRLKDTLKHYGYLN